MAKDLVTVMEDYIRPYLCDTRRTQCSLFYLCLALFLLLVTLFILYLLFVYLHKLVDEVYREESRRIRRRKYRQKEYKGPGQTTKKVQTKQDQPNDGTKKVN